jgi:hypothetical protein
LSFGTALCPVSPDAWSRQPLSIVVRSSEAFRRKRVPTRSDLGDYGSRSVCRQKKFANVVADETVFTDTDLT